MSNESAAIEAATRMAAERCQRYGGAVQAASATTREQARTALHARARMWSERVSDLLDFIAAQPGCTVKTDSGTIVMFVNAILADPAVAAAFVAASPSLVQVAKVVAHLGGQGRSLKQPDWLVMTPDGRVGVDPARISSEPAFFDDNSRAQYESDRPADMPIDPTDAGRIAYAENKPRSSNPLTVSGGRGAWFAAWDAALAEEEAGPVTAPAVDAPPPAPDASPPLPGNREQRRAAAKAPKKKTTTKQEPTP